MLKVLFNYSGVRISDDHYRSSIVVSMLTKFELMLHERYGDIFGR